MPLVRSFALSTKKGKETWVQPIVDREQRRIRFEIRTGPGCPEGTVGRNGAVCLATGTPVPLSYIRAEGKAGRMGAQLMAIVWDFAEGNPFSDSSGNIEDAVGWVTKVMARLPSNRTCYARQRDALSIGHSSSALCATDPPYYDSIGYADLSDFFYVWLRRSVKEVFPTECSTLPVPKAQELIADPFRHGGEKRAADMYFESGMSAAFERMRQLQTADIPLSVFYAFKQAEGNSGDGQLASTGWETMLEGLLHAGLSVSGTWPMRSELGNRPRSIASNALASSIVLICRPRPNDAALATRKEFLNTLKGELPSALRYLQQGNIAPVHLAQAAIGPGMGIFSRYSKVIEADGQPMSVRTALGVINQVLDETLAEQEADSDAETRWALAWFEQYAMNPGPFGVAETLSKAKNTAVNGLVTAGIVNSKAGKVRLLDRSELPTDWSPVTDRRLTVWETTQHLIRMLDTGGEAKSAELMHQVGAGLGETARELSYRLYILCERKKWAKEALAYNALVVSWPEIVRLAGEEPLEPSGQQRLV